MLCKNAKVQLIKNCSDYQFFIIRIRPNILKLSKRIATDPAKFVLNQKKIISAKFYFLASFLSSTHWPSKTKVFFQNNFLNNFYHTNYSNAMPDQVPDDSMFFLWILRDPDSAALDLDKYWNYCLWIHTYNLFANQLRKMNPSFFLNLIWILFM